MRAMEVIDGGEVVDLTQDSPSLSAAAGAFAAISDKAHASVKRPAANNIYKLEGIGQSFPLFDRNALPFKTENKALLLTATRPTKVLKLSFGTPTEVGSKFTWERDAHIASSTLKLPVENPVLDTPLPTAARVTRPHGITFGAPTALRTNARRLEGAQSIKASSDSYPKSVQHEAARLPSSEKGRKRRFGEMMDGVLDKAKQVFGIKWARGSSKEPTLWLACMKAHGFPEPQYVVPSDQDWIPADARPKVIKHSPSLDQLLEAKPQQEVDRRQTDSRKTEIVVNPDTEPALDERLPQDNSGKDGELQEMSKTEWIAAQSSKSTELQELHKLALDVAQLKRDIELHKAENARQRYWNIAQVERAAQSQQQASLKTWTPRNIVPPAIPPFRPAPTSLERAIDAAKQKTLTIYSDGSFHRDTVGGAGVAYELDGVWHGRAIALRRGNLNSNDCELEGISYALQLARNRTQQRPELNHVVIKTDSENALHCINGERYRPGQAGRLIEYIVQAEEHLASNGVTLELWWIKGHSGSPGNDRADALAKIGALRSRSGALAGTRWDDESFDADVTEILSYGCLRRDAERVAFLLSLRKRSTEERRGKKEELRRKGRGLRVGPVQQPLPLFCGGMNVMT